jgi:hypothetical protein
MISLCISLLYLCSHFVLKIIWIIPTHDCVQIKPRIGMKMDKRGVLTQKFVFFCRMVLEWREREHEEVYAVVHQDLVAQVALKRCGLYKFWALKGMRAQVRLLEMLVGY